MAVHFVAYGSERSHYIKPPSPVAGGWLEEVSLRFAFLSIAAVVVTFSSADGMTMEDTANINGGAEAAFMRLRCVCVAAGIPMKSEAEFMNQPESINNDPMNPALNAELKAKYPDAWRMGEARGLADMNRTLSVVGLKACSIARE